MKESYLKMDDVELWAEMRRRYGDDFDINNKELLRETLKKDDGLLLELFRKSARAAD